MAAQSNPFYARITSYFLQAFKKCSLIIMRSHREDNNNEFQAMDDSYIDWGNVSTNLK